MSLEGELRHGCSAALSSPELQRQWGLASVAACDGSGSSPDKTQGCLSLALGLPRGKGLSVSAEQVAFRITFMTASSWNPGV